MTCNATGRLVLLPVPGKAVTGERSPSQDICGQRKAENGLRGGGWLGEHAGRRLQGSPLIVCIAICLDRIHDIGREH